MNKSIERIVLLFSNVELTHLGKDVFLVPYYLGKAFDLEVNIIFPATDTNTELPQSYRGVNLIRVQKGNHVKYTWWAIKQLLFKIHSNTLLMLFHTSVHSVLLGILFKMLKKNSLLYIKCDGDYWVENLMSKLLQKNFSGIAYRTFLKEIDIISVETKRSYNYLNSETSFPLDKDKICFFPNGFDEDVVDEVNIVEKKLKDKENVFLVVGRLGTFPKNTEVILRAAKRIKFRDWKIVLIGPLEVNFQRFVDDFFSEYPHLRDKVLFIGAIYNKKDLYEWYSRSKVFLLPSRSEGSAIVLPEAKRFKNYIIATEVGGVLEAIEDGYGAIIPQDDEQYLSTKMQEIIDDSSILIEKYKLCCNINISYGYLVKEAFSRKLTV